MLSIESDAVMILVGFLGGRMMRRNFSSKAPDCLLKHTIYLLLDRRFIRGTE